MEKLLTVRELAMLLGVTPTCVYRWLAAGKLPAVRFSKRCVRFKEQDVQELLEKLKDVRTVGLMNRLTETLWETPGTNLGKTSRVG